MIFEYGIADAEAAKIWCRKRGMSFIVVTK
jgi:hypothetical protein